MAVLRDFFRSLLGHQESLLKDSDFDPNFSQLLDFTQFAKFDLTSAEVRQASRNTVFSPRARRAFVVKNDLQYGLARMFELYRDLAGEVGIRIFRSWDEALDWVLPRETVPGGTSRD